MKQVTLVYMVAGLSSRFGGKAKPFARVGPKGETLLEYSLNQALKNNFSKIVFIVSRKTERLYKEYFGDSYKGIPIFYAMQEFDETVRERPWGTNDALCSAKEFLDGPFVVCNGDDIYGENVFRKLFEHLQENEENITAGYKLGEVLSDKSSVNRGIFEIEGDKVKTITETLGITRDNLEEKRLDVENLCSMNLFGLNLKTFNLLCERLDKFKEEHKGDSRIECYLPMELNDLVLEGKIVMKVFPTEDLWIGITSPEDEEVVRGILKREKIDKD